MKILSSIILLLISLLASSHADLPVKPNPTRYASLWNDSPFTSKPPPPERAPTTDPFENYALTGIAPVSGGYRVTIVNKNNLSDKKVIYSDQPGDLSIVSVNRTSKKAYGTTVVLSTSTGIHGTVAFDREAIKPKAAVVAPENPPNAGLPPGVTNPNPNPPAAGTPPPVRTPRPRIVPDSNQSGNKQPRPNKGGERGNR